MFLRSATGGRGLLTLAEQTLPRPRVVAHLLRRAVECARGDCRILSTWYSRTGMVIWRVVAGLVVLETGVWAQEDLAAKDNAAREALVTARYAEAVRLYRELTAALP